MGYEKGRFSGDVSNPCFPQARPSRRVARDTISRWGNLEILWEESIWMLESKRCMEVWFKWYSFLGEWYFSRLFIPISKLRSSYYILRFFPFSGSWRFLGWTLRSNCQWTLRIIGPSNGSVWTCKAAVGSSTKPVLRGQGTWGREYIHALSIWNQGSVTRYIGNWKVGSKVFKFYKKLEDQGI